MSYDEVNLRVKSSLPETVDRLGLYLRDDKLVKEWSVDYDDYTHSLSLRGGNESDRRGNPSCHEGSGRVCLFAYWLTVDRHGHTPSR